MILLDGKKLSIKTNQMIKEEILQYKNQGYRSPALAIIMVGNNPASQIYVNSKNKRSKQLGFLGQTYLFDENATEAEVINQIKLLNQDPTVDGILIQLPLPNHLDTNKLLDLVDPLKDVDGFNVINQGLLFQSREKVIPATPLGIVKLLEEYQIDVNGLNVCVVGRSLIVGNPVAKLMMNLGATVTVCYIGTRNLKEHTLLADLIIVATGVPKLIKADMVKEDVIIIDVGINRVGGEIVGDVDFLEVSKKASYITPVPGGVGPMTVTALLLNTLMLYKKHLNL
ncbi:MAG: bifunctional 5,10-methylenetetrahydrofolate dehydrogenase/5,10-methenyltetrahydrofolate cyclohydrolase [Acholeplasmataceae bacterium]|nr:bifunctional 5,10-methylenetetrahydrofolate dehydrogenase/5,10-methenyltetrahydrofolate cyclohydrolase [Acholeplasmataceae bacterium]